MSRYQNDLYQLNNQLLLQIKLELDSLVTLHEQIFKSLSKKLDMMSLKIMKLTILRRKT